MIKSIFKRLTAKKEKEFTYSILDGEGWIIIFTMSIIVPLLVAFSLFPFNFGKENPTLVLILSGVSGVLTGWYLHYKMTHMKLGEYESGML